MACLELTHCAAALLVQDGKLLPGQKGLSMSEEQWGKLVSGMPALTQALGK